MSNYVNLFSGSELGDFTHFHILNILDLNDYPFLSQSWPNRWIFSFILGSVDVFFSLKIRFYISQMLLFSVNGPKVGGVAPGAAIYIEGVTLRRLLFSLAKMDKCQI